MWRPPYHRAKATVLMRSLRVMVLRKCCERYLPRRHGRVCARPSPTTTFLFTARFLDVPFPEEELFYEHPAIQTNSCIDGAGGSRNNVSDAAELRERRRPYSG